MKIDNWPKSPPYKSVFISTEFCEYPLARDPSIAPEWYNSPCNKNRECVLHVHSYRGEPQVVISLPKTAVKIKPSLERCPNRFDLDVLWRLLPITQLARLQIFHETALEAAINAVKNEHENQTKELLKWGHAHYFREGYRPPRMRGLMKFADRNAGVQAYMYMFADIGSTIARVAERIRPVALEFRSWHQLLRALERDPNSHEDLASVKESLELWSALSVWYRRWIGEDRRFDPFIDQLDISDLEDGPIVVRLSAEYLETGSVTDLEMELPLPLKSEAALNFALLITNAWRIRSLDDLYRPEDQRLCRNFKELCDLLSIPGDDEWQWVDHMDQALFSVNRRYKRIGNSHYQVRYRGTDVYFVERVGPVRSENGEWVSTMWWARDDD